MNTHHWSTQAHAGNLGDESTLVLACVVSDIGGRATHVEPDDSIETGQLRHLHRPYDATRGTRQDRVLALEPMRVGETTIRLHELQAWSCRAGRGRARQIALDLIDVAPQDRRQVRIDERRVSPRDKLHQRACFMAHRDLGETDSASELRELALMLRITVSVHQ